MSRLLLAVAVAAILVLVGAFVPVNGKTLVERWSGAPAARSASRPGPKGATSAKTARPGPATAPKPAPEPVEHHTDADRTAIDRIVAEHAAEAAPPRR